MSNIAKKGLSVNAGSSGLHLDGWKINGKSECKFAYTKKYKIIVLLSTSALVEYSVKCSSRLSQRKRLTFTTSSRSWSQITRSKLTHLTPQYMPKDFFY